MPELSIIIPARNECYLARTLLSTLSAIRGNSEIIVVLDGYIPDEPLPDDSRLRVVHNQTPRGQRPCTNEAARISDAKYILKTDAHVMFADGFDVDLIAACNDQTTVLPRMYTLHAHDMVCQACGTRHDNYNETLPCPRCNHDVMIKDVIWQPKYRKKTDHMWFRAPDADYHPMRVQYWDAKASREFPDAYREYKKWRKRQPPIADTMAGIGCAWLMQRKRYWDLGGLDEGHGHWGQMGVEIACKSWLSGGRQVVNTNTWVAHFFRCGDNSPCPWPMKEKDCEAARTYSIALWTGGQWPQQKRPLSWLADKFPFVPTWQNQQKKRNHAITTAVPHETASDISVLIPARNEVYLQQTIDDLCKHLTTDYEILVGLDGYDPDPPLKSHPRVRLIRTKKIGMRPMINHLARLARGKYLMRMDAHCAVAKGIDAEMIITCEREGHVTVVAQRYELNVKKWKRRNETDVPYRYLSYPTNNEQGLRSLPWPEYATGREHIDIDETMTCSGSSWTCLRDTFVNVWGGFDESHGTFGQEGCEIACMTWLSGGRFLVNKRTWYAHWNRGKSPYAMGLKQKPKSIGRSHDLWLGDQWPLAKYSFQWLVDKFHPPGWPTPEPESPLPAIRMGALYKGWRCSIDKLWAKRHVIADPGKRHRLDLFWPAFRNFAEGVLNQAPNETGYRQYLMTHLSRRPVLNPDIKQKAKINKSIKSSADLALDIRENGLRGPLEFYVDKDRLILWKGYRRLVILACLGSKERIPCRVFKDRQAAGVFSPQANLTRVEQPGNMVHALGADQFAALGHDATDKYWVHGYTRYYDQHLYPIRNRIKQVMEIGLLRGASLALWRRVFPRAQLYGVDIHPTKWKKYAGNFNHTQILIGDETDQVFMKGLHRHGPYDLIIDDASHDPRIQLQTFQWMWPTVRQYGYYVIEDTYRSFDDSGRGRCVPDDLPTALHRSRDVLSIHWHYNIVFIQKAAKDTNLGRCVNP